LATMQNFASLACICFVSLFAHKAFADSLPAQQIMSQQEMRAMGLDKLNPDQKAAFERWAANFTHQVIEQAPSYRPGQNLSLWIQNWPSYANPTKSELTPEDIQMRQMKNQVIDRVRNNGEYIDLRDGSSWFISPVFRNLSTTWQKNHIIEVYQGQNQNHPWILKNVNFNQTVEANMAQPPSPTGKKEGEPPEFYKGAIGLQMVTGQGDYLSLADGSVWKIAPVDMYKASKWNPNDRIRVERSGDFLYNWRLTNLDTGESVLANPRK